MPSLGKTKISTFMKKINTFLFSMFFVAFAFAQDSVNITLTLNMAEVSFDSANVYVAGGGNFGNPGDFQLIDPDNDSTFTITVRKPLGFNSFYTFANGNCPDYSCKEDISGQSCADPNNFNDRYMGPIMSDTTILHCFGQCTTDGTCSPPVSQVEVTLEVDMSGQTVDSAGIFLGANINGWSGSEPLSDLDGDSIYSIVVMVDPGLIEYKFVNGTNWEVLDSLDGQSCVMNFGGFVNRTLDVTVNETVCHKWESCNTCFNVGINDVVEDLVNVRPTRVQGAFEVSFMKQNVNFYQVEVIDMMGHKVYSERLLGTTQHHRVNTSTWAKGIYLVRTTTKAQQQTIKILVD